MGVRARKNQFVCLSFFSRPKRCVPLPVRFLFDLPSQGVIVCAGGSSCSKMNANLPSCS